MSKFVIITGGVLSSVGKGVITSSIGKMLQTRGFSVTALKIDPYVNVDAGTMNPHIHGEVYVTEDGGEADLDLGSYERFLDINIHKDHNMTTGQIYGSVIDMERRGDYLGKCVQVVPQVTDEIKSRIRAVGSGDKVDIMLIEVGGTVGDIESLPFLEALRQLRLEEGSPNTISVHVSLVPILDVTEEFKTKPTQHSVNELRRIGIQPDVIIARSTKMIDDEARKKIALFGSIPEEGVFCSYNVGCIYELPSILDSQGMGDYICTRLGLNGRKADWSVWDRIVDSFLKTDFKIRIALVGKYVTLVDSYVSMNEALKHAGAACKTKVEIDYIESETLEDDCEKVKILEEYDGIFVPYGFGPRGVEGKIRAIQFARENDTPFLGICYGFQLATVEFARNVCGLEDANSTEVNPETLHPVIDLMPEQEGVTRKGATMRLGAQPIMIEPETIAHRLYQNDIVMERHRHRFEVNPKYWETLNKKGLVFSGASPDGLRKEILELPDKFFFLATQFHPEFKSRPGKPDPAYYGFVKACTDKRFKKTEHDQLRGNA
ncbi:MAG TPA: CTP synthase [Candidatus Bathyarchaeia archaeon]|nr:MAG: CTP synthase [Candidatus Bathyarchaeota archaeon RBG_16_48_13]HJX24188.1 CTP synthase [Candidatus Bathyarchaeia archaeon]